MKRSYHRDRWTDKQNELLCQYYTTHGAKYTAALLGRSVVAIRSRARMFGLKGFETNTWDDKEIRTAEELYNKYGPGRGTKAKIARALGRTQGSVVGQLRRQGKMIRKQREWTSRESRIVRRYYGKETVEQIGARIDRSGVAVMKHANDLGMRRRPPAPPWTQKDDRRLRTLVGKGQRPRQIADALKRTKIDVVTRIRALGIGRPSKKWMAAEDRLLRKLQPTMPYPEIARRLGRPVGSVRAHIHILGLGEPNTARPWTKQEDARLRKLYGTMRAKAIGEKMGRSVPAVSERARKLGLVKEVSRSWSAQEERELVRLHGLGKGYEEIAKRLDRTSVAVQVRANRLGLNTRSVR